MVRARRGSGRVFVATLVSTVSTVAAATPPSDPRAEVEPIRVVLDETLPKECAAAKPLLDRVASRTDRIRRVASGAEAEASVRVVIRREGDRMLGHLTLEEEAGRTQRIVSAPSCDDVVAAFAVMLVVALDPDAESRSTKAPAPLAGEPRAAPPQRRPLPVRPRRSRPATAVQRAPALGVRGGVGVSLPAYDGPVFEHSILVELRADTALRPRVRAGLARSSHHEVLTPSDRVDLVWTTGRLSFCGGPGWLRAHDLALCAGAWVGALDATVARPQGTSRTLLWASAGPSAVLGLDLGWRLRVEIEAGVSIPALRDRFFFEPATLAYSAPLVVPFVGMSLLGDVFRSPHRAAP